MAFQLVLAMVLPFLHPTLTFELKDELALGAFAKAIATLACAGDLLRLCGPMGAGKTTFTQHFLKALGWQGAVPSPTYTLLQTYRTARFNVAHIDCYRLTSPTELVPLGLEAYRTHGIVLAEWPEKGGEALSAEGKANGGDLLNYHINSIENPGILTLEIEGAGSGPRRVKITGSPSWQRRFGMLLGLGMTPDKQVTRGKSEDSRRSFLDAQGLQNYTLQGQGGDWSGRSYARITLADGTTRMLMDAPPPIESVAEYAAVAEYYRSIGLRAAAVYGRDDNEGYLLTEDLGDKTLWHAMAEGPQTPWFALCGEMLAKQVQTLEKGAAPAWARQYTRTDWWVEGARLVNWYLPFATGEATSMDDYARWQQLIMPLYDVVNATPRGLMMWDCQSPNLMLTGGEVKLENLALIDHQDARIAPVGQDVGLLVRNIRTGRNDADEEACIKALVKHLGVDEKTLRRSMAIGAWHHMVRILGGLTRLAVRDGRPAPAKAYLARTWEVAEQCATDPLVKADLAGVWAFMEPYKQAGLAKLETLKEAA